MSLEIQGYINEFKKHYRYSPTNLGKIERIENYITNLQEENKEWSMIFDTFSKRPYAHKYLEEKKKELGNKKIIGLDSEMIYKDYYDYKSRNEKAIEFIDNYDVFKEFSFPLMKRDVEAQIKSSIDYEFKSTFRNKLKNILGGDE